MPNLNVGLGVAMWCSCCLAQVWDLESYGYYTLYNEVDNYGLVHFEWDGIRYEGVGSGWAPVEGADVFYCGRYDPTGNQGYLTRPLSHGDIVIASGSAFLCCFGGRGSASVKPYFVQFEGGYFNGDEITYNGCPDLPTWQSLGSGKYCINERIWEHCGGAVSMDPDESGMCALKSMQACTTMSHCGPGYYKSGSSCIACPDGGTTYNQYINSDGADGRCYLPKGTAFSDSIGTGTYNENCYWAN